MCIAMAVLQRSKFDGGITLQNIRKYYEAYPVNVVNEWAYADQREPAYRVDTWGMGERSYLHALYGGKLKREARPATQTVVQVWHILNREMK